MNVGLFGGTFDPIHRGHLAVAQAATSQFKLEQIHFVVAGVPPHKPSSPITDFVHRYAMAALATSDNQRFIPSLLEAPRPSKLLEFHDPRETKPAPNYSIGTVRRLRSQLRPKDRLFFIVGADSFLQISTWREPEALLEEVELIIAPRPGFSVRDVAAALPPGIRLPAAALKRFRGKSPQGTLALPGATLHFLTDVEEKVSSTAIRKATHNQASLERYVGPAVAEYIRKQKLYV